MALAPAGAGGRDVDVVRLALQDPAALAKQREGQSTRDDADRHPNGVIIDISRKRVLLDGEPAGLTYKEFELLQYLVLREGRTIDRHELIDSLWDADDEAPSERTIDVHVRRLRSKLGALPGHRAHRARHRLPLRPPRRRLDPPGLDAVARPLLTGTIRPHFGHPAATASRYCCGLTPRARLKAVLSVGPSL